MVWKINGVIRFRIWLNVGFVFFLYLGCMMGEREEGFLVAIIVIKSGYFFRRWFSFRFLGYTFCT